MSNATSQVNEGCKSHVVGGSSVEELLVVVSSPISCGDYACRPDYMLIEAHHLNDMPTQTAWLMP